MDVTDSKFHVNKDVVDEKLVKEDESSVDEEAEEKAVEGRKERAMARRWHLMQQNRISVLNDSRKLFEPMFVIFGTLCYIRTFLHLCLNVIKVLYVIVYVGF